MHCRPWARQPRRHESTLSPGRLPHRAGGEAAAAQPPQWLAKTQDHETRTLRLVRPGTAGIVILPSQAVVAGRPRLPAGTAGGPRPGPGTRTRTDSDSESDGPEPAGDTGTAAAAAAAMADGHWTAAAATVTVAELQ